MIDKYNLDDFYKEVYGETKEPVTLQELSDMKKYTHKSPKWSKREMTILRNNYSKFGSVGVVAILEHEGYERTNESVRRKAKDLKIKYNR